jgi:hypothetical protein
VLIQEIYELGIEPEFFNEGQAKKLLDCAAIGEMPQVIERSGQ